MFEKLRRIRNEKNISAKEMAKALKLATEAAYYKKESGSIKFSVQEAKIVADMLNMTIEEVFFENEVNKMETVQAS